MLAGILRNRTDNEKEDIVITVGNLAYISSRCSFIIQTNQVSFTARYEIYQFVLIFCSNLWAITGHPSYRSILSLPYTVLAFFCDRVCAIYNAFDKYLARIYSIDAEKNYSLTNAEVMCQIHAGV